MFFFFKKPQEFNWLLRDEFRDTVAAGSVNATTSTPSGDTRTATDTNSKISIGSSALSFATGAAANNGVWYPSTTRVAGKTLVASLNITSDTVQIGYDASAAGPIHTGLEFSTTNIQARAGNASIIVGVFSNGVLYKVAVVMRASGALRFIQGGAFANFELLYPDGSTSAAMLPGVCATDASTVFSAGFIRIPNIKYVAVPTASDGFSAVTTDGAGHAEGSGYTGQAYTAVGTWGVAAGIASCSALSGGLGFRYIPSLPGNVIIDCEVTRTAGNAGIVARYADANNYLIAYTEGTNAVCDQVVAGTPTTLRTGAVTYGAGNVLRLVLESATSARLFYNNLAVGAAFTVPSSTTGSHGLYTTDTGNSFDDFIVWARGTEGQYNGLFKYAKP